MFAEAGEGGKGIGEGEEGDFGISDGEAEAVFGGFAGESEAEFSQKGMERFGTTDLVEHAHGGDVERAGEGVADGDRAVVAAVVVFRGIEAFLGLIIGGDVGDDGAGVEALVLEGEGVGEGLEGGAGGTGNEGSIDLSAVAAGEVGRSVKGEDFPGGIFDDDNGAMLDVFFAKFCQFVVEDLVSFTLEPRVDAEAGSFREPCGQMGNGVWNRAPS